MTDLPSGGRRSSRGISGLVASGIRWNMVDQVFQQVTRVVITLVLTRLIAPSAFGIITMALVITQLTVFISDAGFGAAIVQRRDLEQRHVDVAFTATSLLGAVFTVGLIALAGPLADLFDEPRLRMVLVALSPIFFMLGVHATPLDLLRRELLFRSVVVMSTISTLVAGAVGVSLAVAGAGVWALVAYSLAEAFGASASVLVLAHRAGVWRPGISFDRGALRDLSGFSAFVTGSRLMYYGINNFDNGIVGRELGPVALGYYGLAYRIMLYPIQRVADVIATVTFPAFSTFGGDRERMTPAYLVSVQAIALVCFPMTVGLAVIAPPLVPLVFGSRWAPAVGSVQLLALAGPRLAVSRLNGVVFQSMGKASWEFALTSVGFVSFVAGFLIGVHYGIAGVALSFTIVGYLQLPFSYHYLTRVLGTTWRVLLVNLRDVTLATAAMAIAALAAREAAGPAGSVASIAAAVAAGGVVYAAVLRSVAPGLIGDIVGRLLQRS